MLLDFISFSTSFGVVVLLLLEHYCYFCFNQTHFNFVHSTQHIYFPFQQRHIRERVDEKEKDKSLQEMSRSRHAGTGQCWRGRSRLLQ